MATQGGFLVQCLRYHRFVVLSRLLSISVFFSACASEPPLLDKLHNSARNAAGENDLEIFFSKFRIEDKFAKFTESQENLFLTLKYRSVNLNCTKLWVDGEGSQLDIDHDLVRGPPAGWGCTDVRRDLRTAVDPTWEVFISRKHEFLCKELQKPMCEEGDKVAHHLEQKIGFYIDDSCCDEVERTLVGEPPRDFRVTYACQCTKPGEGQCVGM